MTGAGGSEQAGQAGRRADRPVRRRDHRAGRSTTRVIAGLSPPRQKGPRLEALSLQSTADGAPMACVFGRARVAGQVIWAARFLERRNDAERRQGRAGTRRIRLFAELRGGAGRGADRRGRAGVGRRPAAGPVGGDDAGASRDRGPDARSADRGGGGAGAGAFAASAYVVFEDLPLGPFGNRAPQLAFEVFRRPRGTRGGWRTGWKACA